MRIRYGILLFAAFIVLSFTMVVLAQDSTCPALVQQALSDVGDNCSDLSRNAACYGFNRVNASFFQEVAADTFSAPADRTDLTNLETVRTAPRTLVAPATGP